MGAVSDLAAFMRESLRIEGIHRAPTDAELSATAEFLRRETVSVDDLVALVSVYAPGKRLRTKLNMNVRVGLYVAPKGGPQIKSLLRAILTDVVRGEHPWHTHRAYERLHPFMDGNGRSGRTLWLWQMERRYDGAPLGFLHHFYYQTLEMST